MAGPSIRRLKANSDREERRRLWTDFLLSCVAKSDAERMAVSKSPVVPKSDARSDLAEPMAVPDNDGVTISKEGYVFHFVPNEANEQPTCFPFWATNYGKKRAECCRKECKRCHMFCGKDHAATTQCPPCWNHIETQLMDYIRGVYTTKDGPIELSVATRNRTYMVTPWTFRLHGMVCSLIISVEIRRPKECIHTMGYMLIQMCLQMIAWNFERNGFSDKAIVDVYTMMHEKTWDHIMQTPFRLLLDERTVEELSPAYKVVIVASWGGQLKVAGDCMDKLSVIGDGKFEDTTTHELMLYGEPSGAMLTIRKKAASDDDVFMMVNKRIRAAKLTSIAKEHDDVEQMARSVLALDKKLRAAWVAKMDNPSGHDAVELSSLTRFDLAPRKFKFYSEYKS